MLLGRHEEERAIADLIEDVDECGGALLLIGEPGIGKSALLEEALKRASRRSLRVLTTTGIQAESRLPYAGLHQLLLPLRRHIAQLPERQRDAILTAFGHSNANVPDRFLVALAVTELLGDTAATEPLLVLADDAHWLDSATCDVLAFVARRIDMEPIAMVMALRNGYETPLVDIGLPELRLDGLTEASARDLIEARTPGLSDARVRELLAVSLGNPLALTELTRYAGPTSAASPNGPALTERIEEAFAARWRELPEPDKTVLLIAALNEGGAPAETLQAASLLLGTRTDARAFTAAASAQLIDVEAARLRFRHPLVRSAIEQCADLDQVVQAHACLADVMSGHPDRQAWHRAAATLGPDESVATELDAAATRAERRAAITLAITAAERAAEVSETARTRDARLLRAAQLCFDLGRPASVERYVNRLSRIDMAVVERGKLALLEESLEDSPADGTQRVHHLVRLAGQVAEAGAVELAMEVMLGAARRCWWVDPGTEVRRLVAESAYRLVDRSDHPTLQSVLAFAAPDEYGGTVRETVAALSPGHDLGPLERTHLGIAGTLVGEFERSRALFAGAIPQLRSERRLGPLVRALNHDAYCAIYTCDWSAASAAAEESERVAVEAGQYRWVALAKVPQAVVAALCGDTDTLAQLTQEAERVLLPAATSSAMAYLQFARGTAALGVGNYQQAYEHLQRIYEPRDQAYNHLLRHYALADLADAAAHSGHQEEALRVSAQLARDRARIAPFGQVNLAFAAAVLTPDDQAGELFEKTLTDDLRRWPFHYARLKLAYGGWMRRRRRSAESRSHLRTARELFEALGAAAWRDRAEQELRASGERPRGPRTSQHDQISPQELQIATMVVAGLSNREIGERLCISHRTVAYHLYRMFPKLGITSRAELRTALGDT